MASLRFLALLLLFIAAAFVSNSSASHANHTSFLGVSKRECNNGFAGECVGRDEEEMEMGAEAARRRLHHLGRKIDYISYDALKRDMVPCSQRGSSYYNCVHNGQANPYHRGCSYITRCARILH